MKLEHIPRTLEQIKILEAPTPFNYADMAILLAFGTLERERVTPVTPELVQEYFSKSHPAISPDISMGLKESRRYLEFLHHQGLLDKLPTGQYTMRPEISREIVGKHPRFRSTNVDEHLFWDFEKYCAHLFRE